MRTFWNWFFLPFCILYSAVALIVADSDFKGFKRLVTEIRSARTILPAPALPQAPSHLSSAVSIKPDYAVSISPSSGELPSAPAIISDTSVRWLNSGSSAASGSYQVGLLGISGIPSGLDWMEPNDSAASPFVAASPTIGIRWPSPSLSTSALSRHSVRPANITATEFHWVGPNYPNPPLADGDFNVSQNWIDTSIVPNHGIPGSADTAVFTGGSYTVTVTQAGDTVDTLSFAGSAGAMPILNLTQDFTATNLNGNGILTGNKTLTISNYNGIAFEVRGGNLFASSVANGSAVTVTNGGSFIVNNDVSQFNGMVSGSSSRLGVAGDYENSNVTVTNSGGFRAIGLTLGTDSQHLFQTVTVNTNGTAQIMLIAQISAGFLDIDSGGQLQTGSDLILGGFNQFGTLPQGSGGHAMGAGSGFTVGGTFVLGANVGVSSFNVGQEAKIITGNATLGSDAGSEGDLSLQNAAMNDVNWEVNADSTVTIGSNGKGVLNIQNGGAMKLDPGGAMPTVMFIGLASGGDGTANVLGSNSKLDAGGADVVLGNDAGSIGRLSVSGAAQFAAATLAVGNSGRGIFTLSSATSTSTELDAGVGATGNGTIQISSAGNLTSGDAVIGLSGNGDATVSGSGATWAVNGNLTIGANDGAIGSVTVANGGILNVTGASVILGANQGSNGTLTLRDSSSSFTFSGALTIGALGSGTLNVENGFALNNTSSMPLMLGIASGSVGTLNINTGASAKFTGATIGSQGTGTVTVDQANLQNSSDVILGQQAGGSGMATITGTGSTWQIGGNLVIGLTGQTNNPGVGHVMVSNGGTLQVNGSLLTIGQEVNSVGTLTVDGSGSQVLGTGASNIEIGRHGSGTLQLLNGAQFTMPSVTLGVLDTGKGTVSVDGSANGTPSTFTTTGALTIGGVSNGELDVTGGGVAKTEGNAIVGRDQGSVGVVNLTGQSSQWIILTGSDQFASEGNLTVSQSGSGTLNVSQKAQLSVASLTISQNQSADSGNVNVSGDGTQLTIDQALTLADNGTGNLSVRDGAAVIAKGNVVEIARQGGTGTLNVTGDGTSFTANSVVDAAPSGSTGVAIINVTSNTGASKPTTFSAGGLDLAVSSGTANATVTGPKAVMMLGNFEMGLAGQGSASLSILNGGTVNVSSGGISVTSRSDVPSIITIDGDGSNFSASSSALSLGGTVGGGGGGPVNVNITNGGDLETAAGSIGVGNQLAKVTLAGSASSPATWNVHGELDIGVPESGSGSSGNGELDIGSFSTVNVTNSSLATIGGGSATLNVIGQNAALNMPSTDVIFGGGFPNGSAQVSVKDGGRIAALDYRIEGISSSNPTTVLVSGDNSLLEANSSINVGPNSLLIVDANGIVRAADRVSINGGTVQVLGGGLDTGFTLGAGNPGVVTVSGATISLTVSNNGVLSISKTLGVNLFASAQLNGGSIDIGSVSGAPAANTVRVGVGGTLKGDGSIIGTNGQKITAINAGGTIAPGFSPGTLSLDGDYFQQNNGVLEIQIAGTNPADFDHLNVSGHITLEIGSILVLDFLNGFAPKAGDQFDFLTGGSTTGTFTNVQVEGVQSGWQFQIASDGTGGLALTSLTDAIAVPEPESVLLLTLGLAIAVTTALRRRVV